MQGLSGYGSGSASGSGSEDERDVAPTPARPPIEPSMGSTRAVFPSSSTLSRVKATTTTGGGNSSTSSSRASSPLPGVKVTNHHLPSSNLNSPGGRYQNGKGKQRSSSPPPYERATTAEPTPPSRTSDQLTPPSSPHHHRTTRQAGSAIATTSNITLDSLSQFNIPPLPTLGVNPNVQSKIDKFVTLAHERNLWFNDTLESSKAFRNPRILSQLVGLVGVEETSSMWGKAFWDVQLVATEGDARRIATMQKDQSEARQQAQAAGSRSNISFTSASSTLQASHRDQSENGRHHDAGSGKHDRDRDRNRDRDRERSRGGGADKERDRKRSRWGQTEKG
ncbi:BZ3500_MvSof-1268-A1-R1_Chr11-1g03152 [Microbotryum saponariae]|uniref:BZ3500_MvSof-1268-A1-R1_Chr11-1g03152 protein n=1 Tax=Microbotryum saponariae TaxID=289078 RepID=A0A2X0N8P2_9BASI|nr:BZ3501_MvSof-1269-A2-R1_Chr11g02727 [Microbotryum saponariae]SDA03712.1 BZ3500_MvSof-1268-A1-R1_Chr11-1g03152 [Microbotryum saponariae]